MRRGEVWQVNLNPTLGVGTMSHPCVIVNGDSLGKLPLKIVIPLTTWKPAFNKGPWHVFVKETAENGLSESSSADTFQVRSVSEKRLLKKLGYLSPAVMEKINQGLALSLSLDYAVNSEF